MEIISSQVSSVAMVLVIGASWGAFLDVYRIRRRRRHYTYIQTAIWDLLFWVFSFVLISLGLLVSNWLEIRLYVPLSLISGFLIYLLLGRPVICPLAQSAFSLIDLLSLPGRKLWEWARFITKTLRSPHKPNKSKIHKETKT
jgi:spore cortex biosynthesis protein YabQ